jgi:hypothetical protein
MGDPYKGKLAGHALVRGARAIYRSYPDSALCECGAESEPLKFAYQRVEWHRQHKADKIDDFVANGVDDRGREVHL